MPHEENGYNSSYHRIKKWEPCLEEWARTRGEVGKLGALVIEPYLDEPSENLAG